MEIFKKINKKVLRALFLSAFIGTTFSFLSFAGPKNINSTSSAKKSGDIVLKGLDLLVLKPIAALGSFAGKVVSDSVKSAAETSANATKFIAKTFIDSYVRQLGKAAATVTLASVGLISVMIAYKIVVKKYFSNSGNNDNGGDGRAQEGNSEKSKVANKKLV